MTRGTLTYLDYDFKRNNFVMKISYIFNGDMATNMVEGKKVLKKLRLAETPDHFEKAVWDTVLRFDYADSFESEDPSDAFETWNLLRHNGTSPDNQFAFTMDAVIKMFHFADFQYIVPYRYPFYVKDEKGHDVVIQPRQVAVFRFGELEKVYNPKETTAKEQ